MLNLQELKPNLWQQFQLISSKKKKKVESSVGQFNYLHLLGMSGLEGENKNGNLLMRLPEAGDCPRALG